MSKTRFLTGTLVASSNRLKQIASKRLIVEVRYTKFGNTLNQRIVGIRQERV